MFLLSVLPHLLFIIDRSNTALTTTINTTTTTTIMAPSLESVSVRSSSPVSVSSGVLQLPHHRQQQRHEQTIHKSDSRASIVSDDGDTMMTSSSSSSSSCWKSRPTSLIPNTRSLNTYATIPVATLKRQYNYDCQHAVEDGVRIRPRSQNAAIRTLQWNIHNWTTATDEESDEITQGFVQTMYDADADVLILNEYHWGETDSRHTNFELALRNRGYTLFCGSVECPTAVATRLDVLKAKEVRLSPERSAICILVTAGAATDDSSTSTCWVIGTHVDHLDGNLRRNEISILLNDLSSNTDDNERVIMAGDFNQQRRQDYTTQEWNRIVESMKRRHVCEDDGVYTLLQKAGFKCAWSDLQFPNTNWETSKPPATHWSGTVIDYSYGKNVVSIQASISPAPWSDHRMTVCDWNW